MDGKPALARCTTGPATRWLAVTASSRWYAAASPRQCPQIARQGLRRHSPAFWIISAFEQISVFIAISTKPFVGRCKAAMGHSVADSQAEPTYSVASSPGLRFRCRRSASSRGSVFPQIH